MTIQVLMPALSPTMTEGFVVAWHKREGDGVKAGEVLVDIETDKAVMEVEATADGVLEHIEHAAGPQAIAVGTVIAVLRDRAAAAQTDPALPTTAQETKPAAPAAPAPRQAVTPLARRLGAELGVQVSELTGSGPSGRVVKADVVKAAEQRPRSPAAPGMLARQEADSRAGAHERPHGSIRRVTAQRLLQSTQTIPHFYLTVDCQLDELLELKAQFDADGTALTLNDFVIAACARALKRVPQANASWSEDSMLLHDSADIAVAVSTPRGLLTPIIFGAHAKGLQATSSEMRALANAARQGSLAPHQYQGGTFSISNLGKWGVQQFTAIINPPQACILAVGAAQARPVVRSRSMAVATVMTCTLSADHRVLDGADAAEFLSQVKMSLEKPVTMLL